MSSTYYHQLTQGVGANNDALCEACAEVDSLRDRIELLETERDSNMALAEKTAHQLGEFIAAKINAQNDVARLRGALERTMTAINARFGNAQRNHIVAQARAALASTAPAADAVKSP